MKLKEVKPGEVFKTPKGRFLMISGRNWEPLVVTIPGYHASAVSNPEEEVELEVLTLENLLD